MQREKPIPGAGDELNDGAEEKEGTVEGKAGGLPVRPQQPIKHLVPLSQMNRGKRSALSRFSGR